jgi:hypothetical protein
LEISSLLSSKFAAKIQKICSGWITTDCTDLTNWILNEAAEAADGCGLSRQIRFWIFFQIFGKEKNRFGKYFYFCTLILLIIGNQEKMMIA